MGSSLSTSRRSLPGRSNTRCRPPDPTRRRPRWRARRARRSAREAPRDPDSQRGLRRPARMGHRRPRPRPRVLSEIGMWRGDEPRRPSAAPERSSRTRWAPDQLERSSDACFAPRGFTRAEPVGNQIRSGGLRKWNGEWRHSTGVASRRTVSRVWTWPRSMPAGTGEAAEAGASKGVGATVP